MSRNEGLHACPTCGAEGRDMGLRDYRKLTSKLPGRVGAMDFDFVLQQSKTDRKLVMEFKRPGQRLDLGARITLQAEVKHGADVWVIWELGGGKLDATAMNKSGQMPFIAKQLTDDQLASLIADWWAAGWEEEAA